uniref:Cysteine-rich receptor-like protein kinase 25 n=1 Tax=Aegilops tauschii TaxID=37682 RepID=M8B647_AEGTA
MQHQIIQLTTCTHVKFFMLDRNLKILVNAIIVPLLATLFCFIVCFVLIRAHKKEKAGLQDKPNINVNEDELVWGLEGKDSEFTFFDFSQISNATSNFSDENKLGQGGFGPVYKGQFPDGREMAIKRLASNSGQDDTKRALLKWNKRLAIIEGIAQGLLYLHKHSRLRVIRRDLKASNILLDNEMQPKISDFGLAKIFSSDDIEGNTTRIVGTYGYMARLLSMLLLESFSTKSDVFSFGVLILEIISGKRNSCFDQQGSFFNLLGDTWKSWKEKRCLELLDASLALDISSSDIMRCVSIALSCVQENADDQPTMSDVVSMLSTENMTLPEPNNRAYFQVR